MSPSLDRIDLKILRLLQADGRMNNAEIAKRVNTSAATCHRRMQRLFDEGYIRGVHARIAPEKVGRGSLVIVGVVLDRSTPESFAAFEAAAQAMPTMLDCHLVAGDFDYFLKIRVSDMADFNRLHSETLIALPGVRQTRTYGSLTMRTFDGERFSDCEACARRSRQSIERRDGAGAIGIIGKGNA